MVFNVIVIKGTQVEIYRDAKVRTQNLSGNMRENSDHHILVIMAVTREIYHVFITFSEAVGSNLSIET